MRSAAEPTLEAFASLRFRIQDARAAVLEFDTRPQSLATRRVPDCSSRTRDVARPSKAMADDGADTDRGKVGQSSATGLAEHEVNERCQIHSAC
mmetsp:Transcript_16879/g.64284  ORF Transcript_16879/g.64284 Transcript_16879/m.64284 type:complete len:94 (+) Transcript_16879:670-951(+)|eukprot:scaffold1975_cov241-Pinguiococcus_pyrenoidosus.AAC.2